ncbi:MAG: T9SS type A sorting domain-containing protein [Bacteroidota bacterium]
MKYFHKFVLFFFTYLLTSPLLWGQNTPDFSFQMYITDAQGNRDSVTIGYGPSATILLDQNYDETDITSQPFDSTLEMRTGFSGQPDGFQSKTQITDWSCNSSFTYQVIGLSIYTQNYPVVLSWDMDQFESVQNPCHKASVLVEEFLYFNFPMITFNPVGMSSSPQTTLQSDFGSTTYNAQLSNGLEGEVRVIYFGFLERPLSGTVDTDKINGLSFTWQCDGQSLMLRLPQDTPADTQISIWDVQGREWPTTWRREGSRNTTEVGDLPTGIYMAKVVQGDGAMQVVKWIKK